MRIESFHIDGFGVFNDQGVEPLSPGLAVFYGPNESGKSTLTEFLRSVLFGPPKRRANPYPPLAGGPHGGRLRAVLADGRRLHLHLDGRHHRILEEGQPENAHDHSLEPETLWGLDRGSYERLFAVGLEDLQGLDVLNHRQTRDRIFTRGMGAGSERLPAALAALDREISEIVGLRPGNRLLDRLEERLERLEEPLRETRRGAAEYRECQTELAAVKERLAHLQQRRQRLHGEREEVERLTRARGPWQRLSRARKELRRTAAAADMPPEGRRRLEEVEKELASLEDTAVKAQNASLAERSRRTRMPLFLAGGALALAMLLAIGGETSSAVGVAVIGVVATLFLAQPWRDRSAETTLNQFLDYQLEARKAEQTTLLDAAGGDRERFLELAEEQAAWEKAREDVVGARLELAALAGGEAELADFERRLAEGDGVIDEARLIDDLHDLEGELRQAEQQVGALTERMATLGGDDQPGRLRLARQVLEERRRRAVRRWASLALTESLLRDAAATWEHDRRPRVIRRAADLLALMTGGRYRLVAAEEGGTTVLELEEAGLKRKGELAWSSGLADQVYLALRLGLSRELARKGEPLPLLLDDIHVRFDPDRRRAVISVALELARDNQVIFFSCQPEVCDLVAELRDEPRWRNVPAGVFRIDNGRIERA
ncbi:MAG: AAA family ATPase [Acidobacteriota bacterium]